MAKKGWGRMFAGVAVIGAAVAGIAYYKKYKELMESTDDDYEDSDDDLDEDLDDNEDDEEKAPGESSAAREYVSLRFETSPEDSVKEDSQDASEADDTKAAETADADDAITADTSEVSATDELAAVLEDAEQLKNRLASGNYTLTEEMSSEELAGLEDDLPEFDDLDLDFVLDEGEKDA